MRKSSSRIVQTHAKSIDRDELMKLVNLFSDLTKLEDASETERRYAGDFLTMFALELGVRVAQPTPEGGSDS